MKRVAPQSKTASGILLPDNSSSKLNEGTVVAVGPGARDQQGKIIPLTVAVGQKVLLPEYGQTIKIDNEEYHIYRENDIIGILKD